MDITFIVELAFSVITVLSACVVAFSRDIVRSGFALLGVFAGVLGLYVMLSADFVAVIQLVVYIGGILVLILFAVMFTTKIGERKFTNRKLAPLAGLIAAASLGVIMWRVFSGAGFDLSRGDYVPTTAGIGSALLGKFILPFEIVSVLLVLVLVGALVIARREVK